VRAGFYTDVAIYHAVGPQKLLEFGLSGDKKLQQDWDEAPALDDAKPRSARALAYKEGTLAFATRESNSRTTRLFFTGANFNPGTGDTPGMYLTPDDEAASPAAAAAAAAGTGADSDAADARAGAAGARVGDRILPIGRLVMGGSSGDDDEGGASVQTLRSLFEHWAEMQPRCVHYGTLWYITVQCVLLCTHIQPPSAI
jgi:hypothetical protein